MDSIVDIVGTAICRMELQVDRIVGFRIDGGMWAYLIEKK